SESCKGARAPAQLFTVAFAEVLQGLGATPVNNCGCPISWVVRRRTHDETTVHIRASCLRCSRDLLLDGWRRTGDPRIHAAWGEWLAPCSFDFCGDRHYSFSQVSLLEQTCGRVECSTSEG